VASDIRVHHENCNDAALYFDRFSPDKLATQVQRVLMSPDLQREMSESGINRSSEFSWEKHVRELLELSGRVLGQRSG
jgi:glycosyltransferase involved in cell wall biosynthesis